MASNEKPMLTNYTLKFKGADRFIVNSIDYEHDSKPEKSGIITDSQKVSRIIEILSECPKKGDIMKSMLPHKIITVVGYKKNQEIGYFSFHRNYLKAEDSAFYHSSNKSLQSKIEELSKIINSAL